mmetsp:Transcript_4732/g.14371  ORF Transcript_4732/g.14371 Transcript_4732/m.14371 type:complete len:303 (+) Transcript_4732:2630-3538(+)
MMLVTSRTCSSARATRSSSFAIAALATRTMLDSLGLPEASIPLAPPSAAGLPAPSPGSLGGPSTITGASSPPALSASLKTPLSTLTKRLGDDESDPKSLLYAALIAAKSRRPLSWALCMISFTLRPLGPTFFRTSYAACFMLPRLMITAFGFLSCLARLGPSLAACPCSSFLFSRRACLSFFSRFLLLSAGSKLRLGGRSLPSPNFSHKSSSTNHACFFLLPLTSTCLFSYTVLDSATSHSHFLTICLFKGCFFRLMSSLARQGKIAPPSFSISLKLAFFVPFFRLCVWIGSLSWSASPITT